MVLADFLETLVFRACNAGKIAPYQIMPLKKAGVIRFFQVSFRQRQTQHLGRSRSVPLVVAALAQGIEKSLIHPKPVQGVQDKVRLGREGLCRCLLGQPRVFERYNRFP